MQGISLNEKDYSAFIWQVLSLAAAYVFLISADFITMYLQQMLTILKSVIYPKAVAIIDC